MRNSLKYLLSGLLLTAILLLNISFASADPLCEITTSETTCNNNGGIVLMRISGSTNAHGALESQSNFPENQVVCCYEISGGSYACTGDNKIIGLSSAGNAHAERPELDSQDYEDHVCYSTFIDVMCTDSDPGNLAEDEVVILKMSSETNAHLASADSTNPNYEWKVIGQVGEGGEFQCTLQDAYWENDGQKVNETNNYVLSGTSVELVVKGSELCEGEPIDFEVIENSIGQTAPEGELPGPFIFSGSEVNATWEAQYMELTGRPPRYYFTGESETTIESGKDTASLLTVYDESRVVNFCSNYTDYFEPPGSSNPENEKICVADPYKVAPASVSVNCDVFVCSCIWYANECTGSWSTGDGEGTCIIEDQKIIKECNKEPEVGTMIFNWTATWTGDEGSRPIECKSGPKAILCPAEIPLPFFNAYNFVAALLLIAAVYFVLSFRKPKKRQVKKRKK